MEILKRPKILPCECPVCGAVFIPGRKDIFRSDGVFIEPCALCPFCNVLVTVKFKKGDDTDAREVH